MDYKTTLLVSLSGNDRLIIEMTEILIYDLNNCWTGGAWLKNTFFPPA